MLISANVNTAINVINSTHLWFWVLQIKRTKLTDKTRIESIESIFW